MTDKTMQHADDPAAQAVAAAINLILDNTVRNGTATEEQARDGLCMALSQRINEQHRDKAMGEAIKQVGLIFTLCQGDIIPATERPN